MPEFKVYVPVTRTKTTTLETTHLRVSAHYNKGETNLLTGNFNGRGYYVSVLPVDLSGRFEVCMLFHGMKRLIETAARLNKKRLEEIGRNAAREVGARCGITWEMVEKVAAAEGLIIAEEGA